VKKFSFNSDHFSNSTLRLQKITENDLPLIRQLGLKDWSGKEFGDSLLVRKWVVNENRSVIFMALGGGAFEIPEMYDLIYKGRKIRLECGGGGLPARQFVKNEDQSYENIVSVTHTLIPPELSHEQDSVMALAIEAFAAITPMSSPEKLTVEFKV
jgi:hypothetical protein